MEILNLFPLSIYKSKVGLDDDLRKTLIQEIYNQENESKNNRTKMYNERSSWTGDVYGHEYLYKEKKFEVLYDLIGKHIINYAKKIGYNEEKIDFYYQRSWATVSRKNEYIKYHNHSQSHLSFAYYLKKDKDQGAINFHDNFKHNEIIPGTFDSTSTRTADFLKLNVLNAAQIRIEPNEDEIIVFPSKTFHSTSPSESDSERISISADVSIISKNSNKIEKFITPVPEWQKFK